jgi:hypothetical protein
LGYNTYTHGSAQGYCLYRNLIQTKMSFLLFYKIGEHEGGTGPMGGRGGTSGRGEEIGKGCRRVNMVEILCTHVCKQKKMIPIKIIPRMGKGDKGEWWRG